MSKNQNEQKQVELCVGTFKPITVVPVLLQTTSPAAIRNCRYRINLAGTPESALHFCFMWCTECGWMFRLRTVFLHWPFAVLLLLEAMFLYEKNSNSWVPSWWDLLVLQTEKMNSCQQMSVNHPPRVARAHPFMDLCHPVCGEQPSYLIWGMDFWLREYPVED